MLKSFQKYYIQSRNVITKTIVPQHSSIPNRAFANKSTNRHKKQEQSQQLSPPNHSQLQLEQNVTSDNLSQNNLNLETISNNIAQSQTQTSNNNNISSTFSDIPPIPINYDTTNIPHHLQQHVKFVQSNWSYPDNINSKYSSSNYSQTTINNTQNIPNFYQEQPTPMQPPSPYAGPSHKLISNLPDDLKDVYYYLLRDTYSNTTCNIEDAMSLFPEVYTDEKFFKLENERVFKKSWICVGHSDQLRNDGDALSIKLGNTPIILTNYKGDIYGFYNVCRHRGSILLKEGSYKNTSVIRCPYHCWGYSGCGKLLGAPYFNDNKYPLNKEERKNKTLINPPPKISKVKFDKKDYGLFKINVKEWGSMIFINLDKNESNAEKLWYYQLGDLPIQYSNWPFKNLKVVGELDYTVNANWKMIAENFMEYYHLPWVHPELCQLSSVANHIRAQGMGHYTGFGTSPLTNGGTPGDADAFPQFSNLTEVERESGWFIHLFPNVSLFIYPHHIASLITYPVSPNITKEKLFILMDKSIDEDNPETAYKIQQLYDFLKLINEQDIGAVERAQEGILCNDVYRGGKLTFKFEETIYRFQNILIDYMTGNHMKHVPGDENFLKHVQQLQQQKLQSKQQTQEK